MKMMKLRDIKQILTSLGELVNDLGKEEEGGVRHASLESFKWPLPHNYDLNIYDT